MFSAQVAGFDVRVNSKYLLESNLTPSNMEVTISHVSDFPYED